MTLSARPTEPGLESIVAKLARQVQDLLRTPGQWIYVGTYPTDPNTVPESPPFEDGWGNVGGTRSRASFYIDKHRRVHIRGAVTGGGVGSTIFTLPVGYRPASDEPFLMATSTGNTPSKVEVLTDGSVVQVA